MHKNVAIAAEVRMFCKFLPKEVTK
jgi:hypothetical protein